MKAAKTHWKVKIFAAGRPEVAGCSQNITTNLTNKRALVTCKTCLRFVPGGGR